MYTKSMQTNNIHKSDAIQDNVHSNTKSTQYKQCTQNRYIKIQCTLCHKYNIKPTFI